MADQAVIEQEQETPRVEKSSAQRMFRWSTWVHAGEGADECPVAQHLSDPRNDVRAVPACSAPDDHFHAWCRLPNQFQHRDIREKALAAKARRVRLLKDRESDAHAVMEAELEILYTGSSEPIIDEILTEEFVNDYPQAIRDVDDLEEFEHIHADQERFKELAAQSDDERPADEFEELRKHIERYAEAIDARMKEIQTPRRQALGGLGIEELVGLVRTQRVEQDAQEEFMHTYNYHQWFAGTYRVTPVGIDGRPKERYFASIDEFKDAAPEVIEALHETFTDLERAMQQAIQGNS